MKHPYKTGDRVLMKETITADATEDLSAQHFCSKGEVLVVRKVTGEKDHETEYGQFTSVTRMLLIDLLGLRSMKLNQLNQRKAIKNFRQLK